MGEIVNLRRARKRQAAEKAEREAAANRLSFGVSKHAKDSDEAARALSRKRLDAHRRDEKHDID